MTTRAQLQDAASAADLHRRVWLVLAGASVVGCEVRAAVVLVILPLLRLRFNVPSRQP